MVEGQHHHARAEADAARALGGGGQEHRRARDGAVLVEVMLGHPEGVEAPLVRGLGLLEQLRVEVSGGAPKLRGIVIDDREEAEAHQGAAPSSPMGGRSSSRASANSSPSARTSSRRVALQPKRSSVV